MTFDFAQIDEMMLAKGKHSSPQEGLCFMEMVAWFADEKHSDHPVCACSVLGAYGIGLNDKMPDDVRDRLLKPMVPLMAGTRDKPSEVRRAEFLAMWATNKVLPVILRARGLSKLARACEGARTLDEARTAAYATAAYATAAANAAYDAAANAAYATAAAEVWEIAVEGLRQAIMIGRHDGFEVADSVLVERHHRLREIVNA